MSRRRLYPDELERGRHRAPAPDADPAADDAPCGPRCGTCGAALTEGRTFIHNGLAITETWCEGGCRLPPPSPEPPSYWDGRRGRRVPVGGRR